MRGSGWARAGLLAAAAVAGGALVMGHLQRTRETRLRMDLCLRVEASCMGPSLAQEESLMGRLARTRRSRTDRAQALLLLRGLRDCWRYAGNLGADAPDDGFFRPLHEAEDCVGQAVQAFDDAVPLNPRGDAGTLSMALVGLRGIVGDQRRYLQSFAASCRSLPWTPAQAQALDQWAQSLQPGRGSPRI